jgi:hypothetical protein
MVQPKYSPEEALEKMKLMMKYDSSKTLNENRQIISEQTPSQVGYTAAGALAGGAYAAGGLGALAATTGLGAAATGAAAGTAAFPVVGTAIGAVVGLGLGMLTDWAANHDYGEEGFRQVMSACSAKGADKLVPKLSKSDVRQIAYTIEDAKGQWNDDEESIANALAKIPTVADLCAVDKKISGGLAEFLDNLTDSPDEWKLFTRPLAGMIEDTEVMLTPEEQKKEGGGTGGKTGGYKPCTGTYSKGCKSDVIAKVQGCLGLVTDGKFGPKTQGALSGKGFTTFTDADVTKICEKAVVEPEVSGEAPAEIDASSAEF